MSSTSSFSNQPSHGPSTANFSSSAPFSSTAADTDKVDTSNPRPQVFGFCWPDEWQYIRGAFTRVNIDSIFSQSGDKPLVAHGVTLSDKLRQRWLAIMKKQMSETVTSLSVWDTLNEDGYRVLLLALSRNLEQQAAHTTKTPGRYKRRLEQMIVELELFTGELPKRYSCYFFDVIKDWISKAGEVTWKTEPMEVEATNTTQDIPMSPAVETAAQRAAKIDSEPTTPEPSSPPQPPPTEETHENEPDLSFDELNALRPSPSPSQDLQVIGHTTRLQQIRLLYKRLKRTNRIAASRFQERLSPTEVVELTHMLERKILKNMDHDMVKRSGSPTERQTVEIHEEYCKRVSSKVEEYSTFKTFLEKVKIYHRRVASRIREAREKVHWKFSRNYDKEMPDVLPMFYHRSSNLRSNPSQLNNCIRQLINAILSRNLPLSQSLNGGNPILGLSEIRDVAKMLESEMAGITSNKLSNANLSYDEQLHDYSTLGHQYINHVATDAEFVEAVQMYRKLQP